MAGLKGTKTEENLKAAFAGESQASVKYRYFASKAKKEGYVQIGEIFEETADNEKEHAKIWYKLLHEGEIPSTLENLLDASSGENFEWIDMYAKYAEVAREEGFHHIATLFQGIADIEKEHEKKFRKLLSNVEGKLIFSREGETIWECMNCGHICIGKEAPNTCPICKHPQGYFKEKAQNY